MKKNFSEYLNEASNNSDKTIQDMMIIELEMLQLNAFDFVRSIDNVIKGWSKTTENSKVLENKAKQSVKVFETRVTDLLKQLKDIETKINKF